MTFTAQRWRPCYSENDEIAFLLNSEESLIFGQEKQRGRKYSGPMDMEKQRHRNKGRWVTEDQ